MDDKIASQDSNSEYKFSDSEVGGTSDMSSDYQQPDFGAVNMNETKADFSSKFNLRNINWRRIAVPGGMILAVLFIYTISSFNSSSKTKSSEQQKIIAQEDAALAQQRHLAELAATAVKPVPVAVSDVGHDQVVIQQKIDNVLQQIKGDQNTIANLNAAISKTQQDMAAVGRQVEQLANTVQQMVGEVDKLKTTPVKKHVKKKVFKLPVAYRIRAIVPGRVWLDAADGSSVTLAVGDKLAGYGNVKVIDHEQEMVVMSNGSIIQYGLGDF